jgi:MFS family permease
MVLSFGNSLLAERGWILAAAGGTTSLALWLTMLSVALGGVLADRTGRYGAVLIGGFIAFALMLGIAARTDAAMPAFAGIGFVCGLPAGAIMSLPTRVLTVRTRAVGMGIFWTIFYLIVVSPPWIGGWLAGATGGVTAAFDFGGLLLLLACACYFAFVRLASLHVATARPLACSASKRLSAELGRSSLRASTTAAVHRCMSASPMPGMMWKVGVTDTKETPWASNNSTSLGKSSSERLN